jgi:peroxiredoxin
MKKNLLATLLLTIHTLLISAQTTKPAFRLAGILVNAPFLDINLVQYFADKQITIATTTTDANGHFVFEDSAAVPVGMGKIYGIGRNGLDVFLDQPDMAFEADAQNVIGTIRFQHSPENTFFFNYQRQIRKRYGRAAQYRQQLNIQKDDDPRWLQRMTDFNNEIKTLVDSLLNAHPDMLAARFLKSFQEPKTPLLPLQKLSLQDSVNITKYSREHFFDHAFLNDERMIYTNTVSSRMTRFLKELSNVPSGELPDLIDRLIKKTENTTELRKYVIGSLAQKFELTSSTAHDELYNQIIEKYVTTAPKLWEASVLQQIKDIQTTKTVTAIGQPFPDLELSDTTAHSKTLSSITADYTILFFYSPGCSHCREKTPKLLNFYKKQKQNVAVCAISLDRNETDWKPFIKQFGTQAFVNLRDSSGKIEFHKLGIINYPTVFVLDKNKHIVARYVEIETLTEMFSRLN